MPRPKKESTPVSQDPASTAPEITQKRGARKKVTVRSVPTRRNIDFKDEENVKGLIEDIQQMCQHSRFRRYRMGVRRVNDRIMLYEGTRSNIKGVFYLPLPSGVRGQMVVNDSIVRSMIRICGGQYVRSFYEQWFAIPKGLRLG